MNLNPDITATQTILHVNVSTSSHSLLSDTKVCFDNSGPEGDVVVSIQVGQPMPFLFVLSHWNGTQVDGNLKKTEYLGFDIQLLLPNNGTLQQLEDFTTYLPWFSHSIGDLANHTTFDSVFLQGAGYDIVSKVGCSIPIITLELSTSL